MHSIIINYQREFIIIILISLVFLFKTISYVSNDYFLFFYYFCKFHYNFNIAFKAQVDVNISSDDYFNTILKKQYQDIQYLKTLPKISNFTNTNNRKTFVTYIRTAPDDFIQRFLLRQRWVKDLKYSGYTVNILPR